MIEFFSPDPQRLYDDLVLLPQEGATTGGTGRPPNSYALLFDGFSVLVDAPFGRLLAEIGRLAEGGRPPRALLLTHRDLLGQGDAFEALAERYGTALLIHPDDAPSGGGATGPAFEDPMTSEALREAGLEPIHFPGHTPGSVMLHWPAHGGVLFAGDSAVAPGPRQDPQPPRLERPLGPSRALTDALAERWRAFDRPLRTICPLHGTPYVDRDDLAGIMRGLWEAPPMDPRGR